MRRRALVYVSASALITVAVVLASLGVGEEAGKLSDWQAFTLGVTQGITELLPISSSGHLILVPWVADWHYLEAHPDFNKTFDVALHLGTLVAVVAYFWADVVRYVRAWFHSVGQRAVTQMCMHRVWRQGRHQSLRYRSLLGHQTDHLITCSVDGCLRRDIGRRRRGRLCKC